MPLPSPSGQPDGSLPPSPAWPDPEPLPDFVRPAEADETPYQRYPQGHPGDPNGNPPGGYLYPPTPAQRTLVGFWTRVGYTLLDGLILMVVYIPVVMFTMVGLVSVVAPGMSHTDSGSAVPPEIPGSVIVLVVLVGLFSAAVSLAYMTLCLNAWGATVGQRILKCEVVDEQGVNIAGQTGTAFTRSIMISLFNLVPYGYLLDDLWCLGDRRRQTLHDKVASTFVVERD